MSRYYTKLLDCNAKGFFALLLITLLAGCNADKKDPVLGVEPIEGLTSIQISPVNPSIAAGLSQQFTALGIYADGTSVDISNKVSWTSATTTVATVNALGLTQALQTGSSVIRASFVGKTASSLLTVTDAELISFSIEPLDASIAAGLSQQFTATGVYSDGSIANISGNVVWQSSDPVIAVMAANHTDRSGWVSALVPGSTEISATIGTLYASTNFTVTNAALMAMLLSPENSSLYIGISRNYTATGIYSDGTSQDISAQVSWASSNSEVATIGSNPSANPADSTQGVALALSAGTSQISASLDSLSAETTLTVRAVSVNSVVVTPTNSTVVAGLTRQFIATANYNDGSAVDVSNTAIWASSNTAVAIMNPNGNNNSGLATSQMEGSAQISASFNDQSGSANLTVTAASLNSILITPANSSVIAGQSRQYTATGVYSDGSSENLTTLVNWTSSDNAIALPNASMNSNSGLV
ncbi:Ig-like domain-containing protein, partial [Alishewanella longhuensis]